MKTSPPLDPFGHKTDAELTAPLGPLITVRRRGPVERVFLWAVLGAVGAAAAAGLAAGLYAAATQPNLRIGGGAGAGVCACLLLLCWWGFRGTFRALHFHQQGLLERTWSGHRVFKYDDVVGFSYQLTRQYINGIYFGTSLGLHLADVQGRSLKYSGTHKEKPKGLAITVLGRSFEGEDELDVVRDVISSYIARRLGADLQHKPVVWGKQVEISTQGLTPRAGRHRGQIVPWTRISAAGVMNGVFHLFADGETRSFAAIPVAAPNFYPSLELFQSLMNAAVPRAEEAPAASAA